jgi:imidazolonepropionase-like amidohydrolase
MSDPASSPTKISITADRALVGPQLNALERASVSISGTSIADFSSESDDAPHRENLIDATGLTLLPGFIDSHVHIGFADPSEVLRGGVTTVRDLAWPVPDIFTTAENSRRADFDGPLVLAAGQMLTVPGGYPTRAGWAPPGTGRPIDGPEDARRAVAEQVEPGACVIKVALNPPVGPTLDARTLEAIVDAAHQAGLRVTGHVYGLGELEKALDAGLDELAHMLMSDEVIPHELLGRMAERIVIVPTLSIRFGHDRRTATRNLEAFLHAGGRVVYGTDLGNEGPRPGIDHTEIHAMSEAGMSPHDVIRSATVDAAEWLGLPTKGALEIGRDADIIGVEGNPAQDITALTRVKLVVREGRIALRP